MKIARDNAEGIKLNHKGTKFTKENKNTCFEAIGRRINFQNQEVIYLLLPVYQELSGCI
jgi:hypothetical protein